MPVGVPRGRAPRSRARRYARRAVRALVPLALAVYFVPVLLAFYAACGLLDALRNRPRSSNCRTCAKSGPHDRLSLIATQRAGRE